MMEQEGLTRANIFEFFGEAIQVSYASRNVLGGPRTLILLPKAPHAMVGSFSGLVLGLVGIADIQEHQIDILGTHQEGAQQAFGAIDAVDLHLDPLPLEQQLEKGSGVRVLELVGTGSASRGFQDVNAKEAQAEAGLIRRDGGDDASTPPLG